MTQQKETHQADCRYGDELSAYRQKRTDLENHGMVKILKSNQLSSANVERNQWLFKRLLA